MVSQQIQDSIETKGGQWGYYRQPDGWIGVAITTQIERLQYMEEGWIPMPEYGLVEMTTKWATDHPLETLFINGGAKELPLEQVVEMGLHIYPPKMPNCGRRLNQYHKLHGVRCWVGARPVQFPQLEGLDIQPFKCRHCKEIRATEEGLQNHETVAHKTEKGDVKMGEALAAALTQGLRPIMQPTSSDNGIAPSELDALRARITELESKPREASRRTSSGAKPK